MRKKLIAGIGLALVAGLALSGCSARGTSGSDSASTEIKKALGDRIK